MQWIEFLPLYAVLFTVVRSNPIEEEIQIHSKAFKSKIWPTNRTLTWKLDYGPLLYDSKEIHQDIQRAFDDWTSYSQLTFREVIDNEKADFNLAFVSGNQSDEIPFDGSVEQVSHSFPPDHHYAGHIHFDSDEKWSHTYDDIGYNLHIVALHAIGSSLGLSNSDDDDDDSIMSSFYRLIQSNEMLSKQNQHSIQALYGNNINPVASTHPNRHVRSVTEKPKRNKKKSKKINKKSKKINKKSKKTKKKPKKTKTKPKKIRTKSKNTKKRKATKFKKTPKSKNATNLNSINERQLVTFEANDTDKIVTGIKRLQHDGTLMAFKNLSESIKAVTGLLPEKFIPVLQNLSASYSTTSNTIKIGLSDSSAILSKFVIKSWHIIQRGMNKIDENALTNIGDQLNTGFKNELAKFVNLSTFELGSIQSELLARVAGGNVTNLLKEKDDLEIDLLRRSEEITNKSSECGENQGKIDSIRHRNTNDVKVIQNSKNEKLETEAEINRLRAQIPDYEHNVRKHLDTCSIQRTGIWPFIRTTKVCADNGERIARENLNRLLDRINDLDRKLKNWSSVKVKQPTKEIKNALAKYRTKKIKLEKELKQLQQAHDQVKKKFDDVTQQINAIYQSTGTINIKSIQVVDELSRTLENGAKSFISACNKIANHLARIQQYPKELADAVLDALKLINIADEYNDSTKIKDIKQVLGIQ